VQGPAVACCFRRPPQLRVHNGGCPTLCDFQRVGAMLPTAPTDKLRNQYRTRRQHRVPPLRRTQEPALSAVEGMGHSLRWLEWELLSTILSSLILPLNKCVTQYFCRSNNFAIPTGADHCEAVICEVEGPAVACCPKRPPHLRRPPKLRVPHPLRFSKGGHRAGDAIRSS
jgi:hypothetical protein